MQPAGAIPTLGDDFAALCEQSLEACLQRVLSVTAQRAERCNSIEVKHSDLVEFIERANRDDDSGPL